MTKRVEGGGQAFYESAKKISAIAVKSSLFCGLGRYRHNRNLFSVANEINSMQGEHSMNKINFKGQSNEIFDL